MGEILQAGDLVACDGCQYAGGECGVDFGVEGDRMCLLSSWGKRVWPRSLT